jgi:hypothetical protein
MLQELGRHLVPGLIVPGQLQRDLEHLLAVERHPAGGVGLLQPVAGRQLRRPVEQADVVHPEEAALEHVGPVGVLPVDPPGEVQQQFGEHPDQEIPIPVAVDAIDMPGRPGMHRRVDVTEFPFVGRQLAVRVHRPFPAHQHQLFLREIRVDVGQRNRVKSQIPGREPGILPFVGHRDDVG